MKKIGYVLTAFPVFSETFVGTEMRSMIKHGHSVVPLVFESNLKQAQKDDEPLLAHIKIISEVPFLEALKDIAKTPIGLMNAIKFARAQKGIPFKSLLAQGAKLAVLAKRNACDHLHAHFALSSTATAIVAGKLLNIPVSFVGHGYDVYSTPWDLDLKLNQVAFSVAVCQQMAKDFATRYACRTTQIVECGIDLQKYVYRPVTNPPKTLLFIGRLTEKKGLTTLLYAMAIIHIGNRPILHIVGTGPQFDELKELTCHLKLNQSVEFLGNKPSQWICEYASNYTALVAPFCQAKNGDRDTGPLVLKEAMALGLPIITTRFMGCIEIVNDQTGYLVSPNDPKGLSIAIETVLALNSDQRLSLIELARHRIELRYCTLYTTKKLSTAIENATV